MERKGFIPTANANDNGKEKSKSTSVQKGEKRDAKGNDNLCSHSHSETTIYTAAVSKDIALVNQEQNHPHKDEQRLAVIPNTKNSTSSENR